MPADIVVVYPAIAAASAAQQHQIDNDIIPQAVPEDVPPAAIQYSKDGSISNEGLESEGAESEESESDSDHEQNDDGSSKEGAQLPSERIRKQALETLK